MRSDRYEESRGVPGAVLAGSKEIVATIPIPIEGSFASGASLRSSPDAIPTPAAGWASIDGSLSGRWLGFINSEDSEHASTDVPTSMKASSASAVP